MKKRFARRESGVRFAIALTLSVAIGVGSGFAPAHAESELRLVYPSFFGVIPASTFDVKRERVGSANLVVERLDDGHIRMFSDSGVDGGARTIASAELAPVGDGHELQILKQSSRSFDSAGNPIGVLLIDHGKGEGSCTLPAAVGVAATTQRLALPAHDRVANVPLTLLFDPLVRGESLQVDFQIMLCRGGPRLMDFEAHVVRREKSSPHTEGLIEVRYAPNLGSIVSFLARAVTPQLKFWFDSRSPSRWLAHRMPLYSDGPEVLVVRNGVPTNLLID